MQHCKAVLNAQRSPIAEETQNWELKASIQTVAPEQVRNEEEPDQKMSRALIKAGKSQKPTYTLYIYPHFRGHLGTFRIPQPRSPHPHPSRANPKDLLAIPVLRQMVSLLEQDRRFCRVQIALRSTPLCRAHLQLGQTPILLAIVH